MATTQAPKKLIQAVQTRWAKRLPLNIMAVKRDAPRLIEAAYQRKVFLGWRGLLHAAGIDYHKINVELEEVVECLICGYQAKSLPPHLRCFHEWTGDDYRDAYPDAELFCESLRVKLGHLETRVEKSGVDHWEPLWSTEYALDRLWFLHESSSIPINPVSINQYEQTLYSALGNYCGGYSEAMERLGLDPEEHKVVIHSEWSQQRILELFADLENRGRSLGLRNVINLVPTIEKAANSQFGSYRTALEAYGVDPVSILGPELQQHSEGEKKALIVAARALFLQTSPPMEDDVIRFRKKWQGAMKSHYTSWKKLAADIDADADRFWIRKSPYHTPEATIEALKVAAAAANDAGTKFTSSYIQAQRTPLGTACLKHFGSFRVAFETAGLPVFGGRKYPDQHSVIAAFQKRQKTGQRCDVPGLYQPVPQGDRALYTAALKYFGNLAETLEAAGLPVPDSMRRNKVSQMHPSTVTKSEKTRILKEIREWSDQCEAPVHARQLTRENLSLSRRAAVAFGSVGKALTKAVPSYRGRAMLYPDRRATLKGLRDRDKGGLCCESSILQKDQSSLYKAILRDFESLHQALKAAGIPLTEKQKNYAAEDREM